jgi:hypothetical protein
LPSRILTGQLEKEQRRFGNDAVGHRQLIKWIKKLWKSVHQIKDANEKHNQEIEKMIESGPDQ